MDKSHSTLTRRRLPLLAKSQKRQLSLNNLKNMCRKNEEIRGIIATLPKEADRVIAEILLDIRTTLIQMKMKNEKK